MRLVGFFARLVLVVVAACSLVSMFALLQVDSIVNESLYSYGLQFSDGWAVPYWSSIRVVFAMGWVTLGVAVAFQVYAVIHKTPKMDGTFDDAEIKQDARWNTYKLGDGSTIKVKLVVKGARRLNKFEADGMPVYVVDSENIVRVVDAPKEFMAKST
jgi:hypothetical protein